MSIIEGLKRRVEEHPNKLASICGDARLTFLQVDERVNRFSNALARLGVSHGDRVAILSLNCHRFMEFYYAVPQLGAIVVPINFRLTSSEIKYIVDHSGSTVLAVDSNMIELIEALRPQLESIEHYIFMSDEAREGYLCYEDLLSAESPQFEPSVIDDDELLGLFYTSGTTAEPKGVMLSHRNMLSNIKHSKEAYRYLPEDIYLHVAPMFHLADGSALFSHTSQGSTQAFIPRFDPKLVLEAISSERVTLVLLVPTMINFVLQQPDIDSYELSSLRHITYGASPIAPDLLRRAMKVLKCEFGQGYGLTEASPLLTVLPHADHLSAGENERRLSSCGKPVAGVEVRVVKEDGSDVTPGEVGEIIARGPNIMLGYWKRPDDTRDALRDGWLHTGDLATVDDEGYIYLVDRKKDMIVTGGENVYSTEVEAVLYAHPEVKEAAVIPIPDADWGEAVHACIALRDGCQTPSVEIIDFCRERLASYKVPRSIEFIDGELPKGGTGKILKKELRERYWKDRARRIG
jgi:long-chain acyl-CoA synthetase